MRKGAFFRICLWSAIAVALVAVLVSGLQDRLSFQNINLGYSTTFSYAESETYTAGDATLPESASVQEIAVRWVAGSVDIRMYDGDTIRFSETASRALSDHEIMRYRYKDGTLTLQFCKSAGGLSLFTNMPEKSLELWIPARLALRKLSVDAVSSDVTLRGQGAYIRGLSLESVSGGLTTEAVVADELDLDTVSGSIRMDGAFGKIDAESVSGSLFFALPATPNVLDAESISGSIHVVVSGQDGFTADFDTVSGSLQCAFADSLQKKKAVYSDGAAAFRFETVSGSVTIERNEHLAVPAPKPSAAAPHTPVNAPAPGATKDPVQSGGRNF